MPPSPIKPMNNPWPIHSGQGGPRVEIERPRPIIKAPDITVQRVPTRSAIRDMMMPPVPEPSHASELASAGTERDPPTSLAMSLSATAVIQAAPNDIPSIMSATDATAQEALVSTEAEGDCNIGRGIRLADPSTGRTRFHHPCMRGVCLTCCIAPKCAKAQVQTVECSFWDKKRKWRPVRLMSALPAEQTSSGCPGISEKCQQQTYPTDYQQAPALRRARGSCRHAAHAAAKPGMTVSANRRMFSREPWPNSST